MGYFSIDRFWRRVDKGGPIPEYAPHLGPCWTWTGTIDTPGYGRVQINKKQCCAHRVAYELVVGPIPAGLQLDHLCRVPRCVNPSHLEPVTQRENLNRGIGLSAQRARQTHCKNGHEFTPANTWTSKRNQRVCRTCGRNKARSKYRRLHGLPDD